MIREDNKLGLASILFGIISIIIREYPYLGIAFSVVSIYYARKQRRKNNSSLAGIGMILGIVGIILSVIKLLTIFNIISFFIKF